MQIAEVPRLFWFVLVGEIQRDFVGVFNKTIIPLALFGYPTRPRGIIAKNTHFLETLIYNSLTQDR